MNRPEQHRVARATSGNRPRATSGNRPRATSGNRLRAPIVTLTGVASLVASCSPAVGPEDVCPGVAAVMIQGQSTTVAGGLGLLGRDYQAYCSDVDGPDAVYTITPQASGTLDVSVASAAEIALFAFAADTCGDEPATTHCVAPPDAPHLTLPVTSGSAYSVALKGRYASADTAYDLTFALGPAACGDGAVNPGEQWDFGADSAAGGLDANCQFSPPDKKAERCPGLAPVTEIQKLEDGKPKVYSAPEIPAFDSFTSGYADDFPSEAPNGAPDRVYRLYPIVDGTLHVDVHASFDVVLGVYTTCDFQTGSLDGLVALADSQLGLADESLELSVTAGTSYFLVVDGYGPAQSPPTATPAVAPSFGHYSLQVSLD